MGGAGYNGNPEFEECCRGVAWKMTYMQDVRVILRISSNVSLRVAAHQHLTI